MTTSFRQMPPHDRATTRIAVDVTFLRLEADTAGEPAPALPEGDALVRVAHPSVGFYRYLYDTVGHAYCWWLRRMTPDAEIAALMAHPGIAIHVLYRGGEPAGFFELDRRGLRDVNLSYFGLMPHAVGTGAGPALLAGAITLARADSETGVVRVNTCTADHPRAMQTYLRAGFRPVRTVREIWDIPDRLGLPIPDRLRA
jgi:GNAT superfamily N-acetyltransferase